MCRCVCANRGRRANGLSGKLLAGFIVVVAGIAAISLYYLQVYAYYTPVVAHGSEDVMLTSKQTAQPEAIAYSDFKAIDSDSSPIRYRGCFKTLVPLTALRQSYQVQPTAEPRVAPAWFDCFAADAVGAALESGAATAFMGTENIRYGIDRIVAIDRGGRGYVWHRINRCGKVVFDGKPVPPDCPKPPKSN